MGAPIQRTCRRVAMAVLTMIVAGIVVACSVGRVRAEGSDVGDRAVARIEVQIDSPFSPFKSKAEERRYAIKNDHTGGALNPLPTVRVQIDDKDAWRGQLVPQGNRMSHIYYARGAADVAKDEQHFVVRVRIESQQIDASTSLTLAAGRFVVISQARDKSVVVKQHQRRPLYR